MLFCVMIFVAFIAGFALGSLLAWDDGLKAGLDTHYLRTRKGGDQWPRP